MGPIYDSLFMTIGAVERPIAADAASGTNPTLLANAVASFDK